MSSIYAYWSSIWLSTVPSFLKFWLTVNILLEQLLLSLDYYIFRNFFIDFLRNIIIIYSSILICSISPLIEISSSLFFPNFTMLSKFHMFYCLYALAPRNSIFYIISICIGSFYMYSLWTPNKPILIFVNNAFSHLNTTSCFKKLIILVNNLKHRSM